MTDYNGYTSGKPTPNVGAILSIIRDLVGEVNPKWKNLHFTPDTQLERELGLDSLAQWTGGLWQLSPSVFVRSEAVGSDLRAPEAPAAFWRCPVCGCLTLHDRQDMLQCADCGRKWAIRDGIYDFKEPLA